MTTAAKKKSSVKKTKSVKKSAPKAAKKTVKKSSIKKSVKKKKSDITVEITQTPLSAASQRDLILAEGCLKCPLCKRARKNQKGFFFWFVSKVERSYCPQCKAYERVYGKKAHEKI